VKEFQYIKPESLSEALSLAERYGTGSTFLAGGTDLIVQMKQGIKFPSHVINLKGISELDGIYFTQEKGLFIGPLVTHNNLAKNPLILEKYAFLAEAAHTIGTYQIREQGTLGGNICNGSPAADTVPPLICLRAQLKLRSAEGERWLSIEEFFEGPQKTRLKPNEILTQIQIPTLPPHTGGVYLKLGMRRALEIAVVGVAALVTLDEKKNTCIGAKIALASVAPIPLRCQKVEKFLIGQKPEEKIFHQAAKLAQEEANPITDLRGTAEYRREMVSVLTTRALQQALKRSIESIA